MATRRAGKTNDPSEARITIRAHEFFLPPVRDALVIGRRSPVGCVAMQRALGLLSTTPFESIEIPNHPIISDVVVRQDILRRVSRERFVQLIIERIAPLMGDTEVFQLEWDIVFEVETGL